MIPHQNRRPTLEFIDIIESADMYFSAAPFNEVDIHIGIEHLFIGGEQSFFSAHSGADKDEEIMEIEVSSGVEQHPVGDALPPFIRGIVRVVREKVLHLLGSLF